MDLEALEFRQHLAASHAAMTGNILTITGSSAKDSINVSQGTNVIHVNLNGSESSFSQKQIKRIRIVGAAGNDRIIVSPKLRTRCLIEAGSGNDLVGGGAREDTIFGQSGNDTLVGNHGIDYLDGGMGDDLFYDKSESVRGSGFVSFATTPTVVHGGGGFDKVYTDITAFAFGVEDIRQGTEWIDNVGLYLELKLLAGKYTLIVKDSMSSGDTVVFQPMLQVTTGTYLIESTKTLDYNRYQFGDWDYVVTNTEQIDITSAIGSTIYIHRVTNTLTDLMIPLFVSL